VLHATISKLGAIEDLQVVSGAPMLVKAALDAVRQWRYRPYFLNDEPVEVDTQVTVNFVLSGG
jgi:periplasmic protein TonB